MILDWLYVICAFCLGGYLSWASVSTTTLLK